MRPRPWSLSLEDLSSSVRSPRRFVALAPMYPNPRSPSQNQIGIRNACILAAVCFWLPGSGYLIVSGLSMRASARTQPLTHLCAADRTSSTARLAQRSGCSSARSFRAFVRSAAPSVGGIASVADERTLLCQSLLVSTSARPLRCSPTRSLTSVGCTFRSGVRAFTLSLSR
jgi:hypothetical protein